MAMDLEPLMSALRAELTARGSVVPRGARMTQSFGSMTLHIAGTALDFYHNATREAHKDIGHVADRAQMAIRAQAIRQARNDMVRRRGETVSGNLPLPAWGIACHPMALWALEHRHPDLEWMRHDDYWSSRGSRALEFDHGTLTVRRLALTGVPARDGAQISMDMSMESNARIRIASRFPDTVTDLLAGRPVRDVFEMPRGDARIDAAVDRVTVESVHFMEDSITLTLAGVQWICAERPPADLRSDCLEMPIPPR